MVTSLLPTLVWFRNIGISVLIHLSINNLRENSLISKCPIVAPVQNVLRLKAIELRAVLKHHENHSSRPLKAEKYKKNPGYQNPTWEFVDAISHESILVSLKE